MSTLLSIAEVGAKVVGLWLIAALGTAAVLSAILTHDRKRRQSPRGRS